MKHQVKCPAVAKSNSGEVARVVRGQATDAERPAERHNRRIDEPRAKIREAPVDFDRTRELTDGWRRVGKGASGEILHEDLHRLAPVAQVVDFGEHETRDVARACLVDSVSKRL